VSLSTLVSLRRRCVESVAMWLPSHVNRRAPYPTVFARPARPGPKSPNAVQEDRWQEKSGFP
jgi:hypothetical protein